MDSYSVCRFHLVKLVNTDNSSICKYQSSAFNLKLPSRVIFGDTSCETGCRISFTWCVDSYWCCLLNKFEKLWFGSWRISNQKYVDITSEQCLVRQMFSGSSKQHTSNGFLNFFITKNTRSYWSINLFTNIWISAHVFEELLFLFSILEITSFFDFLDSSHVKITFRKTLGLEFLNHHNSSDANSISRYTFTHIFSISNQTICTCDLTCWYILRILLDFEGLSINYLWIGSGHIRIIWTF